MFHRPVLECGSLPPPFSAWSLFRVRQGANKLAQPALGVRAALELVFDQRLEQRAVAQGRVLAARGAQQRDCPAGGQGGQPLDDLGAGAHLRKVAPLVFRHADGRPMLAVVVRVELAAGPRVGDPHVPRLPALGQGARAVAADEDAVPVGGRARIVPALETDAHASMIQRSGEDSYSRATSALSASLR